MKHIYISPHADDVALSCGGQILANPLRHGDTLVLTVFTSEPPDADRESWQGRGSFSGSIDPTRNLEDAAAWQSLGVRADNLGLPEALVRNRFPFATMAPGKDDRIIDQICAMLRSIIAVYPAAIFYFPAGCGNHIDHRACQAAAFRLLDNGALDRIMLYEDIPYCWLGFVRQRYYWMLLRDVALDQGSFAHAFRPGGLTIWAYLRRKLVPFPRGKKLFLALWMLSVTRGLLPKRGRKTQLYEATINRISLSNDQIVQKKQLLFHYRSQLPMLFGAHPNRLLKRFSKSLTTEVVMAISRHHGMRD